LDLVLYYRKHFHDYGTINCSILYGLYRFYIKLTIEGCLLIESSDGMFSTPILPEGVTYWDKGKGIVYIYDRGFLIGNIIRSNGIALDSQFQKVQDIFISKAKPSCLKRSSILFGTKFD